MKKIISIFLILFTVSQYIFPLTIFALERDTEGPILHTLSIDKNEVVAGDQITISGTTTDILTGLHQVSMTWYLNGVYDGENNNFYCGSDTNSDAFSISCTVPTNIENGRYQLGYITLYDKEWNYTYYDQSNNPEMYIDITGSTPEEISGDGHFEIESLTKISENCTQFYCQSEYSLKFTEDSNVRQVDFIDSKKMGASMGYGHSAQKSETNKDEFILQLAVSNRYERLYYDQIRIEDSKYVDHLIDIKDIYEYDAIDFKRYDYVEDIEPPQIVNFSVNTHSVITPGVFKIFVDSTDNSGYFISTNIELRNKDDEKMDIGLSGSSSIESDGLSKGTYELAISKYTDYESFYISKITVSDIAGNSTTISVEDGTLEKEFITFTSYEDEYDTVLRSSQLDLSLKLNELQDESKVLIDISNNKVIKKNIFDIIKEKKLIVTFDEVYGKNNWQDNGIQWIIDGKDIINPTKDIDMTVSLSRETYSEFVLPFITKYENEYNDFKYNDKIGICDNYNILLQKGFKNLKSYFNEMKSKGYKNTDEYYNYIKNNYPYMCEDIDGEGGYSYGGIRYMIYEMMDSFDYLNVNFKDNGLLPGKMKVKIRPEYAARHIFNAEQLNLYYVKDGNFNSMDSNITKDEYDFYTIEITHNSDYWLTDNEVKELSKNPTINPDSISMNKSLLIEKGETERIRVDYEPSYTTNKELKWVSENETIASVDQGGQVTGVKEGKTIITATTSNGKESIINVEVTGTVKFSDVPKKSWFRESVNFAYQNNIILGYNDKIFAPYDKVTRGQLVTILWRLEQNPNTDNIVNRFSDVNESDYYGSAIKWASSNGIVNGYGGTNKFGPNNPIIRQDLAVILNNYARYKNIESDTNNNLMKYGDYILVKGSYAETAIKWATANKVINGMNMPDGTIMISPHSNASRAETAAMLSNMINKFDLLQ